MKLSEKIQEALRQQQEINLSDPAVQKRLAAQWGYVPADAQPAPSFADAYHGAMEDVAIWKKRALEAEDLNRKFVAEINGPAYMGEPAQPAPSALAEAIIADMQAQHDSELITENDSGEALIRLDGAIAAVEDNFAQPAPIIPEGWKPIPEKHPTFDLVDLRLADGSVLCGCVPQSDGDYWWEGPSGGDVFIDPRYAPVTHWRLAVAPEAKP